MKKIHFTRLEKLATHLESGERGHAKFNFNHWTAGHYLNRNPVVPGCGTSGCALGECPVLFRKQWRFNGGQPRLVGLPERGAIEWGDPAKCETIYDAMAFFGITMDEAKILFMPKPHKNLNIPAVTVGPFTQHGDKVKRQGVAKQIRRFIAWKKKELSK